MFAAERLRIIRRILLEHKAIDVARLSSILSVSEVTVRRDLEKLEKQSFLIRTHGGAELKNEEPDYDSNTALIPHDELHNEKKIVAHIASYMVNDGESIILGPGRICAYLADYIKYKKNIKVVTTDISVAIELLTDSQDVKVVLTGGDIDSTTYQLTGRIAEENLKSIFVVRSFIEVDGVSFAKGFTVSSIEKASVIKEIINVSKEAVFLCDYTKFEEISFYPIGPLSIATTVISNEQTPEAYKKYFYEKNIRLFTTFDIYKGEYKCLKQF